MKKGKLVVFEGIYGSGRLIVKLVDRMREALTSQGQQVFEIDSPDSGRAQLMGAQELDSSWRYGIFVPDFFFELASRARVCSVTKDEIANGRIVLCKSFTLSSIVYARLKGHDWVREDLNVLEARARGLESGGELAPDLTIFVDVSPEFAEKELGAALGRFFKPGDLVRQQRIYLEEIARAPAGKVAVVDGSQPEGAVLAQCLSAVRALIQ